MEENVNTDFGTNSTPKPSQPLAVPAAIIVGFGLIAAAIYFSGTGAGSSVSIPTNDTTPEVTDTSVSLDKINPVTEDDHIRGNPNAQIMMVEYSDFDCVFCQRFHETMNAVMEDYGADGRVAWVYRQLPFEQLHPSAPMLAQASECVAKLGGNDAFWTFADLVFGQKSDGAATNLVLLPDFVRTSGVSVDDYNACMESGETTSLVEADYQNALAMGVRGTPFTAIMVGGQVLPINGWVDHSTMKQIIDEILEQIEGGSTGTE